MPEWTPEQKNAIDARGGTVLVSAAAGSGKTAVLVERVVGRICDEEDPCDINELLIVTFTRMAAAEMRERIAAALARRSAADPANRRLARQQVLIDQAAIGTIDSFCAALVRENFHALGIASDFTMLDDADASQLKRAACGQALEELYAQNPPGLPELRELFGSGRLDAQFEETIIRVDAFIMAYPFPEEWLDRALASYDMGDGLSGNTWGELAFSLLEQNGEDALRLLESCRELIEGGDDVLTEKALPVIEREIRYTRDFLDRIRERDWDGAYELIRTFQYDTLRMAKSECKDRVDRIKARREFVKKTLFGTNIRNILCATQEETEEDFRELRPVLALLFHTVRRFEELYGELKSRQNQYDFSDIMHLALRLLVEKRDGEVVRTDYARQLAGRYREIMVDEYQDVNEAQEMLFQAVSDRERNLFFVGDVKQSIYGFRQSMPRIFIRRRDRMCPYDGEHFPACISLGRNFRSREGVTDAVNYLFSRIMSKRNGDLVYDETESLVYSAGYPEENGPAVTLAVTEKKGGQPEYIARLVREKIASGATVRQKMDGKEDGRPMRYGDVCVLLRYYSAHVEEYVRAFEKEGIPLRAGGDDEVFAQPEVRVMISLLRVIDNPIQDIPLLAVMFSPIFGFTQDEAARIRSDHRGGSIYAAVCAAAKEKDAHCRSLLNELELLRDLAAVLTPGELVERIYDRTDYPTIASAGKPDAADNLNLLLCCARTFRQDTGVSGLIRYLDAVAEGGGMKMKSGGRENDAVTLMSIHKSKGLEYPLCILAGCEYKMNNRSAQGNAVLHARYGAGLKRVELRQMRRFDTVAKTVAGELVREEGISEGLRLLYVALTRAREELVLAAELPKLEAEAARCAAFVGEGGRVDPAFIANSGRFSDWILAGLISHPDAGLLRSSVPYAIPEGAASRSVRFLRASLEERQEETAGCPDLNSGNETDTAAFTEQVRERVEYVYPYLPLAEVAAKRAASHGEESVIDSAFFASSRPAFLNSRGLTPAQRGTATHEYMQFADYDAACLDAEAEGRRLAEEGFLTKQQAQAVDYVQIARFFHSPLYRRIQAAGQVFREEKFAIEVPAGEYYSLPHGEMSEEPLFIQGIVDCAFVEDGALVIVDYKTDRVRDPESLLEHYTAQMRTYRRAMAESKGLPVKACLLYSFYLGEEIPVVPDGPER